MWVPSEKRHKTLEALWGKLMDTRAGCLNHMPFHTTWDISGQLKTSVISMTGVKITILRRCLFWEGIRLM